MVRSTHYSNSYCCMSACKSLEQIWLCRYPYSLSSGLQGETLLARSIPGNSGILKDAETNSSTNRRSVSIGEKKYLWIVPNSTEGPKLRHPYRLLVHQECLSGGLLRGMF